MRKFPVILVLMISCVAMLTLGCAGRSNDSPTVQVPSATPVASISQITVTPSPTAIVNDSSPVTATPVPTITGDTNVSVFDDSFVNISGEDDESLPEDNIPTPDAGQ
jgi:hypothetical protein